MPQQPSVLLYGQDAQLLDIRRLVLERSGYRVDTKLNTAALDPPSSLMEADLLILCHSLSNEQFAAALNVARARSPTLRTLVLTVGHAGFPGQAAETAIDVMEGPARLVEAVRSLVPGVTSSSD